MKEEFLFCNTLSATITATDVKALVDSFFEANELNWQNFKQIYTYGAPAMIGAKSGFVTLVKNEWPQVTSSHSSLHRYTLSSKTLLLLLMEVLDAAVKVINFICSRAKNHRLFRLLAIEMGAQHVGLLFSSQILLAVAIHMPLSRLYELKNEIEIFLRENKNNLHVQFHNEEFVVMLAYSADVIGHLNNMNLFCKALI